MTGPNVLDQKVNVEVRFARHLLADRDDYLEEPWPPVHSSTMHQKFGRDYCRRKESGGGVEDTHAGLFSDVCDVSEIPCDEIIDLVERRQGQM